MDAIGLELRHIALRGRVGPHLAVHGWCDDQRHLIDRPSQAHQAQQFISSPVQQLGHEVGTRRRHHDRISLTAQVDVSHVVGLAGIPLRGVDRATGQRLHGHGRHEMLGRLGHHNLHRDAGLHQGTAEFGRLERGNAPRQAQNNVFSSKMAHGRQCSRHARSTPGPFADASPTYNLALPPDGSQPPHRT